MSLGRGWDARSRRDDGNDLRKSSHLFISFTSSFELERKDDNDVDKYRGGGDERRILNKKPSPESVDTLL